MQICLQTKTRKTLYKKMLYMIFALCWIANLHLAYNEFVPTKTMYSAVETKYLSVSKQPNVNTFDKANDTQEIKNEKMNNFVANNSKMQQNIQNTQSETPQRIKDFGVDTISVYDTQSKENIQMSLEEYVLGCVLAEMPSYFEPQALMAQAVATRTFTVRKTMLGKSNEHPQSFVCTDASHCQSFIFPQEYEKKSNSAKDNANKIRQAVKATEGIIAVYDNNPINAVYHAASGYSTLSSSQVWGGKVGYLTGVDAPEDATLCSKEYEFTYKELSDKLSRYSNESVECFSENKSMIFVNEDENGCVDSLTVQQNTYDKKQLKNILSLRSEDFSLSQNNDGVKVVTYGYGHRVGMSQYGANALAKEGYSYKEILKYYYTGIGFSFV